MTRTTRARRTDARKDPKQNRAKVTVDAILEAATRLFVSRGYRGTTTNRIAEVAGVSVGSLYQYFPSKEAIIAALVERHVSEVLGELESRLSPSSRGGFPAAARATVGALLRTYSVNTELRRFLHVKLPQSGRLRLIREAESRLVAAVATLVAAHHPQMRQPDVELAAFVLVYLVEGMAQAALVHRPELLRSKRFEDAVVAAALGCVESLISARERRSE